MMKKRKSKYKNITQITNYHSNLVELNTINCPTDRD